jgi:hypothetical protein
MLEQDDAAIIDECLASLPGLLVNKGITLKQKLGYKAGKLYRSRNWCQFVDGDVQIRVCLPNSRGEVKTWKLFARFDVVQPPSWPWDKSETYQYKKAQWMIAGDDVWGVSYEDIKEWAKSASDKQLLARLADDLQISLSYSRQRYC